MEYDIKKNKDEKEILNYLQKKLKLTPEYREKEIKSILTQFENFDAKKIEEEIDEKIAELKKDNANCSDNDTYTKEKLKTLEECKQALPDFKEFLKKISDDFFKDKNLFKKEEGSRKELEEKLEKLLSLLNSESKNQFIRIQQKTEEEKENNILKILEYLLGSKTKTRGNRWNFFNEDKTNLKFSDIHLNNFDPQVQEYQEKTLAKQQKLFKYLNFLDNIDYAESLDSQMYALYVKEEYNVNIKNYKKDKFYIITVRHDRINLALKPIVKHIASYTMSENSQAVHDHQANIKSFNQNLFKNCLKVKIGGNYSTIKWFTEEEFKKEFDNTKKMEPYEYGTDYKIAYVDIKEYKDEKKCFNIELENLIINRKDDNICAWSANRHLLLNNLEFDASKFDFEEREGDKPKIGNVVLDGYLEYAEHVNNIYSISFKKEFKPTLLLIYPSQGFSLIWGGFSEDSYTLSKNKIKIVSNLLEQEYLDFLRLGFVDFTQISEDEKENRQKGNKLLDNIVNDLKHLKKVQSQKSNEKYIKINHLINLFNLLNSELQVGNLNKFSENENIDEENNSATDDNILKEILEEDKMDIDKLYDNIQSLNRYTGFYTKAGKELVKEFLKKLQDDYKFPKTKERKVVILEEVLNSLIKDVLLLEKNNPKINNLLDKELNRLQGLIKEPRNNLTDIVFDKEEAVNLLDNFLNVVDHIKGNRISKADILSKENIEIVQYGLKKAKEEIKNHIEDIEDKIKRKNNNKPANDKESQTKKDTTKTD